MLQGVRKEEKEEEEEEAEGEEEEEEEEKEEEEEFVIIDHFVIMSMACDAALIVYYFEYGVRCLMLQCAAMDVAKVAALAEACMPHCPADQDSASSSRAQDEQALDATDMLPSLDNERTRCGRHCYKMRAILRRLQNAYTTSPSSVPHSAPPNTPPRYSRARVDTTMIVMAEETRAGSHMSPCVLLEGNHRCASVCHLSVRACERASVRACEGIPTRTLVQSAWSAEARARCLW